MKDERKEINKDFGKEKREKERIRAECSVFRQLVLKRRGGWRTRRR